MENKKPVILTVIGLVTIIILVVGAAYAYFSVEIRSNNSNSTVVTGKAGKPATATITTLISTLKLKLSNSDMNLKNVRTYYADDKENNVKTKSEGFHDIIEIRLKNSNKDDGIYKCKANININLDIKTENNMGSVLEKGDVNLFLRWGTNSKTIDLYEIKSKGSTSIPIELEIVGNNYKNIETYVELTNKESSQNYLTNKNLNIEITSDNFECEITGDEAVYMLATNDELYTTEYYRSEKYIDKIKNIYFVDNIDTKNSILEEPWDLTDTSQSPAGSIIGWLEESGDSKVPYNLYIGSDKEIYAGSLPYAFMNMTNVETISFKNFRTDLTTNMTYAFAYMSKLQELDLSVFETCKVTNMIFMFRNMSNLKKLNLNNFDTSKVTSMYGIFYQMTNLRELYLSNWNTSSVTNMSRMFYNIQNLEKLDVSSFNTNKVENMNRMFYNLTNLQKLDVSNFNTSKVENMGYMFSGMNNLQELDVYNFNTSKVTDMSYMFNGISNVKELNLSNFDTSNVTNVIAMFRYMSSLEYLNLKNFEFSQVLTFENNDDYENSENDESNHSQSIFYGIPNNATIIVKDEKNKKWIEDRLSEVNRTANVIIAN